MMNKTENKRRTIFTGRIFEVGLEEHLLPNGREAIFEVIRHVGGAAVLPLLDDDRLLLVRQYRPVIRGTIYEIPAGRLDPGETAEACAHRELIEETGYAAARLTPLGGLLSAVGYCDEYVSLFLAQGLQSVGQALEPDEVIELCPMSIEGALDKLVAGEITDSKTQVALLRLQLLKQDSQA